MEITRNSAYGAYGPSGTQFASIPAIEKRPITQDELDFGAWVRDDSMSQPHWKQLEGVKGMFFTNIGANPKIGEDAQAMDREMDKLAGQFFEGTIDEDALAEGFQRLASQFINACKEKQYPFQALMGLDEAELSVAYDHFRASILKSAVAYNRAEGQSYTSGSNLNWHYYNSDYYYKSESAIAAVTEKAKGMAAERGFDQFEIPDYKSLGKNSCYNFNSAVSGEQDYIPGGLRAVEEKWILDFDAVPPEDFKWFYEEGGVSEEFDALPFGEDSPGVKGEVWAMLGGMLISHTFHYSAGLDQPGDVKNLGSLLNFHPSTKNGFAAVNKFLKSFQVAPRSYFSSKARRDYPRHSVDSWNVKA